jgi:hypothetical protein|nr:MAG TPA: hypothetical protein [Bacteriophage sp.]
MNIINLYFMLEKSDLLENFVLFIKNKKGTN